jgi:hypothetical protein
LLELLEMRLDERRDDEWEQLRENRPQGKKFEESEMSERRRRREGQD